MKNLTDAQIAKRKEQANATQQRQIEKQRAKLADPEWREEQYRKKRASAAKAAQRMIDKAKTRKATPKPITPLAVAKKPRKTYSSKGRTPTAAEKLVMDAIGTLPCIACYMHGVITHEISLHHIDGRTKPDAHKLVLPLCVYHHQHAAPKEVRDKHPWLVPVHACGNVGGKAAFNSLNKPELSLLADAEILACI